MDLTAYAPEFVPPSRLTASEWAWVADQLDVRAAEIEATDPYSAQVIREHAQQLRETLGRAN